MGRRRGNSDTVARVGVGVVAAIALVALAGGSQGATPASSPAPTPTPPRPTPPPAPASDPLGDLARGVPSGSVQTPATPATTTPAGSVPTTATPATTTPSGSVAPTTTPATTTTPAPTGALAAAEELRRLIEARTLSDRTRISDLQRALGVRVDGVVGRETVGAVARLVQATDAARAAREWLLYMDGVVPARRISPDRAYLRELQRRLGGGIPVDGIDGPRTRARMGEALRQDV